MNNSLYEIFNQKVGQFIDDVMLVFPEDGDLKLIKSGFNMIKNIKPKIIHNVFEEHVLRQYKQQILEKDEKFFLTENYEHFEEVLKEQDENVSLMEIVDKVKSKWTTLSDENKTTIWNYLHIFVKLSEKIMG